MRISLQSKLLKVDNTLGQKKYVQFKKGVTLFALITSKKMSL